MASRPPAPEKPAITAESVTSLFPVFHDELAGEFVRSATLRTFPRGTVVYEQGFPCEMVPFIVEGVVRVYKLGETGREVTLFLVYPGQTCIMSTSCGVSGASYPAIAEVEEDLVMYSVPSRVFGQWVTRYPELQQFINETLAERLAEMMMVVEEVAFRRVDLRLAEWLLRESERNPVLETTHARVAVELGSAREVISRILKDFERHDYVALSRGRIEVTGREPLDAYREWVLTGRAVEGKAPMAEGARKGA